MATDFALALLFASVLAYCVNEYFILNQYSSSSCSGYLSSQLSYCYPHSLQTAGASPGLLIPWSFPGIASRTAEGRRRHIYATKSVTKVQVPCFRALCRGRYLLNFIKVSRREQGKPMYMTLWLASAALCRRSSRRYCANGRRYCGGARSCARPGELIDQKVNQRS